MDVTRKSAIPLAKSHGPSTANAAPVAKASPTTVPTTPRSDGFETSHGNVEVGPFAPASVRTDPGGVLGLLASSHAPTQGFGSRAFERALDRTTGSSLRAGNQAELLLDGAQSFAARNQLIDGAKSSINLQTFIFNSDDTGWDLARRLAKKADDGVKVRVIYDALGSQRADSAMFDYMRQHGVEVRPYGKPVGQFWDLNDRWHEKHLIVDGKASIEGGMNIANEYAYGGTHKPVTTRGDQPEQAWRDVDIKIEGPAVHDAQSAFLRNWSSLGAGVTAAEQPALFPPLPAKAGGTALRVVQHRPDEEGDQHIDALYLQAINAAQQSISIENAYFVPPQELRDALAAAARRGVDVRVLTNSRTSSDQGFVADAGRYFYDELTAAGVKIYERQGSTLHSKTAAFDSRYSIVGSANLNGRASGRDSEVVVAGDDARLAGELNQRFSEGLRSAHAVTPRELDHEGFLTNLKQWALSTLAWTF